MKTIIVLPLPFDNWSSFDHEVHRFARTFKQYPPGADYELWAMCCWGEPTDIIRNWFYGIKTQFRDQYGVCDCIAVHKAVANIVDDAFLVCMTSRCYFHRAGWLKAYLIAREQCGPGLYGASASMETEPHICTRAYGIDANILRNYPGQIECRQDASKFEVGERSITRFATAHNVPCLQVRWDGVDYPQDWRAPENIFRRGNQEQMLVWDRHSEIYANATPQEKKELEALTDGV